MSDDDLPHLPELAGLSEAEEFFEALGVRFEPAVLARHRLHVMRTFGLVARAWLDANADAHGAARRAALASALREAHAAYAEPDEGAPACSAFGPPLVRLGPRR